MNKLTDRQKQIIWEWTGGYAFHMDVRPIAQEAECSEEAVRDFMDTLKENLEKVRAREGDPAVQQFASRLLSFGGRKVILCNGHTQPRSIELLQTYGRLYDGANAKRMEGHPNNCHGNAQELVGLNPPKYALVTGYALSDNGKWVPHSWALERESGRVVETTVRRTLYFGVQDEHAKEVVCVEALARSPNAACAEVLGRMRAVSNANAKATWCSVASIGAAMRERQPSNKLTNNDRTST